MMRIARTLIASVMAGLLLPLAAEAISSGTTVTPAVFQSTFPWAVQLTAGAAVCSGELISPTYVIGAAHCQGSSTAYVGGPTQASAMAFSIDSVLVDPQYNPGALNGPQHDVALYHLATPVYGVTPIPLATTAQENTRLQNNANATIAGWGVTIASSPNFSTSLVQTTVQLSSLDRVSFGTLYAYAYTVSGPCAGDSGGPMVITGVLVGITDAVDGDYCSGTGLGAFFTDVSKIRSFVVANVSNLGTTLAPVANPDAASTAANVPVQIPVLLNDFGFKNPATVGIVTGGSHGTAQVNGSPGNQSGISITYTPVANYVGPDAFQYSISDGTATAQATVTITVLADTDGDGIADTLDNCTLVANTDQRDTDIDGYGNLCDPDFNNDGVVNINDFNRLKARLNIVPVVDVDTDLDGNGAVNINDFNRLKSYLGKPPGPSGLHPNCPPTCP